MTHLEDIDEDIAEIFSDVSLGFARYATTSGAAQIPGIFSREYFASDPGGSVSIESSEPVFRAAATSATGVASGDTLTIESTAFLVVEIKPSDGTSSTEFRLQEV